MAVIPAQRRLYPQNGMAAHVIGYTGEISEQELDSAEFAKYNPGDVIGKFGIERQYNQMLMGVDGQRQVVVDNRGQPRQVLGIKDAIPGKDIQLTIDLDLQAVAELAMEGRKGAIVAIDPRTGEVLAMVSRPTFDPNKFTARIRSKDWREIADNPDHPLLNRAIQAQFAPGSTFKPLMALAGLETGAIDEKFSVRCPGGASFYGHYFRCWQKGGHGTVALHGGIVHSCDVYFYNVGQPLGDRQDRLLRGPCRPGAQDRHRPAARSRGHGAVHAVGDAELPAQVVCRGDHFGVHRAGRADGHAAAIDSRHRGHRRGRRVAPPAPAEGPGQDGEAASL